MRKGATEVGDPIHSIAAKARGLKLRDGASLDSETMRRSGGGRRTINQNPAKPVLGS